MRKPWNEYFMDIAKEVATRSTCLRRQVGAIIVFEKRILTTGYNSAPSGLDHCDSNKVICIRKEQNIPSGQRCELCRGLHAEQNAIIQAALHGVKIGGSTLYCTHQPCLTCAKMLINCQIKSIVFEGNYPDKTAMHFLSQSKINLTQMEIKS